MLKQVRQSSPSLIGQLLGCAKFPTRRASGRCYILANDFVQCACASIMLSCAGFTLMHLAALTVSGWGLDH
jgi:hypothetical protein